MSKLSRDVENHITLIINREIDKYKKLLKGAKKNSESETQYDMARIVYADKIEFLQDLRLKLLTESTEDELGEPLDHSAIIGGALIFPNWDFLRDHEEIIDIIYKKFELLCIENRRKVKLGDSISVFVQHYDEIKEINVLLRESNTYTWDMHKEFICEIEEIVVNDDSTPLIDLMLCE